MNVFDEQIFSTNTVKATLKIIPTWGTSLKLRRIVKVVCVKMKQDRILLLCLQNHYIYFTFTQMMFPSIHFKSNFYVYFTGNKKIHFKNKLKL